MIWTKTLLCIWVACALPAQTAAPQSDTDAFDKAAQTRAEEPGGTAYLKEAWDALRAMQAPEGLEPRHVRVLWLGDAATEAVVSWSTRELGAGHRVHFGLGDHGDALDRYEGRASPYAEGAYTVREKERARGIAGAYYHHARLTGLTPGTRYHLVVANDGEDGTPVTSRVFHFFTAAPDGRRFTFLAGGDSRSNALDRCRVNLLIRDLTADSNGVLALVHSGDYIASGRSWRQWEAWLNHHELTLPPSGRLLPLVPARGNHDGGPLYDEVFAAAGGAGANYFTTMLGSQCGVVTLNTNISGAGRQLKFLEGELARLRPNVRWLLVNYHRPLYPAVKSPAPAKPFWAPVFERYNVDLALEGDGHTLKRTCRIRNERFDPTGIAYVGEGGLGVGQRVPRSDRWWFQDGGMAGRGHHIMVLDVSPSQIAYRSMLLDRSVADMAEFLPRAERTKEHPVDPKAWDVPRDSDK